MQCRNKAIKHNILKKKRLDLVTSYAEVW